MVQQRQWEPLIVFSFSRKECELYALGLKGVDFNTDSDEKAYIAQVGGGGGCWCGGEDVVLWYALCIALVMY
jgi:hypothetical protein